MAISLKSEQVWLTVPGGEHSAQAVVEGALALEEEVAQLVDLEIVPLLENVQVEENKITVAGSLELDLLYQPQNDWGGLALVSKRWQRCLPFEQELEVPEAVAGMNAKVALAVSGSRYEMQGGSLELSVMLSCEIALVQGEQVSLATDALSVPPGELALDQRQFSFSAPLANVREQSQVEGVLILPQEFTDLAKIIQSKVKVRGTNLTLSEGEAVVEGVMDVSVLYYTPAPEGVPPQLESLDLWGVLPFHFMVPIPAFERAQGRLELLVDGYELELQSSREILVKLNLVADLDLYELRKKLVLTDLRSKGDVEIAQRKEVIKHQSLIGEETAQFSVQGGLILPSGELPIAQVLRITPFVNSQNVRIVEEQVVVEAQAGFDLLYLVDEVTAESPFQTVTFENALRIEQVIPMAGIDESKIAKCDLELGELNWELLDPSSLRVRLSGQLKAQVTATEELELVVEATAVTELAEDVSMVYYIVQAGDTLWKVASRYGQSVDTLLEVNGDVEFAPGSHLLIMNGVG